MQNLKTLNEIGLPIFFDKCKLISDEEMQGVWARILAGEANKPGTFSKRTVEVISTLDKADAHVLTALCGFSWRIGGVTPLVFYLEDDIYKRYGITFDALTHLESLGLLRFDARGDFVRTGLPNHVVVFYYDAQILLAFDKGTEKDNEIPVGKVLLSQAGSELAPISGSKKVDGFIEYVAKQWAQNNIAATSILP